MKQTTLKLETSDKTNATLAVENIKLKKINQGNVEYYENVNATQKKRELHLLKKEKEWHQKEKNIEVIVNQKYISQIKDNAFKHNQIIKKLKEANVNDLEDLQHRLNMKSSNKIEKLKKHFDHKTQNMCHLHDEQTTRWNDERKKYEAHVKTEHDRTVAELNNNLLSEVDSISSEFRTIYNLAKERAEKHANEGWTSDVAKTRLLSENTELRQTIVDSNNKQNLLYSSLEKKLEDFDIERRNEVMTALQTAHDVKAAHIDRIHQLEMQLSRRNSIVERLTKVSKKVGMGIEELVDKLTKEL